MEIGAYRPGSLRQSTLSEQASEEAQVDDFTWDLYSIESRDNRSLNKGDDNNVHNTKIKHT